MRENRGTRGGWKVEKNRMLRILLCGQFPTVMFSTLQLAHRIFYPSTLNLLQRQELLIYGNGYQSAGEDEEEEERGWKRNRTIAGLLAQVEKWRQLQTKDLFFYPFTSICMEMDSSPASSSSALPLLLHPSNCELPCWAECESKWKRNEMKHPPWDISLPDQQVQPSTASTFNCCCCCCSCTTK